MFEFLTQTDLPIDDLNIQKHPKVGRIRIILLELAISRERRKLTAKKKIIQKYKKNQKKMIVTNGTLGKTTNI